MTVERILKGTKPTEIFREMLAREPGLKNAQLAGEFLDHFDDVDSLARQFIWHWERPGIRLGLSDERLDELLIELLRAAGYAVPDMP